MVVTLNGRFFALLGLAWRVLWGSPVSMLLHPRVALDLSRRLVQCAARAEVGEEEEVDDGDD